MDWCDYPILVRVQKETGKRAVFVVVSAVRLAAVQFDINLVPGVQMQDDAVAGIVVVLVGVLRYGAGSDLRIKRESFDPAVHVPPAGRRCLIYSRTHRTEVRAEPEITQTIKPLTFMSQFTMRREHSACHTFIDQTG